MQWSLPKVASTGSAAPALDQANRRSGGGRISVDFVPFNRENQYWGQLAAHLEDLGVDVGEGLMLKDYTRKRRCGEKMPDIIHLQWLPTCGWSPAGLRRWLSFLFHLLVLRSLGQRFVWTAHNLYHGEAVWQFADRCFSMLATPFFNRIIAHAPTAKALVRREFLVTRRKVVVIPHGNYIGCYPDNITRARARAELGLPENATVFLLLGHLRLYKGVNALIDAFQSLDDDRARLVIAGKPREAEAVPELERSVRQRERIQLHAGFISDERLQVFLRAADVMVIPYLQGLTSGAVVLGMSFALPCVAAAVGCIPDMLDERGGFLYAPGGAEELREALSAALAARSRLAEMGACNLARAREWSWERVARDTAEVYRAALGRDRREAGTRNQQVASKDSAGQPWRR